MPGPSPTGAIHTASGRRKLALCRNIQVGTIKKYVQAIESFLALFGLYSWDYRKTLATDTHLASELTSVYAELDRWEKVPNRREPFTPEMLTECATQTRTRIP